MAKRAAQHPDDDAEEARRPAELLRDADRPNAWVLLIDGVAQSHVDLDDPTYLDFEYVRRLGHVIDTAAPPGQPLRVLHLGAGALTLARYVAATRPRSSQVAVEVDPELVELIRSRLPLGRARLRVRVGDARAVLERLWPGSFDVVIADVFAGGRTPGPPDLHRIRHGGPAGAEHRRRVRGQRGRRAAAGARPGAGGDGPGGLPRGGSHRRGTGAAGPEVRQPGAGGEPGAGPVGHADPAGRGRSDARPGSATAGS